MAEVKHYLTEVENFYAQSDTAQSFYYSYMLAEARGDLLGFVERNMSESRMKHQVTLMQTFHTKTGFHAAGIDEPFQKPESSIVGLFSGHLLGGIATLVNAAQEHGLYPPLKRYLSHKNALVPLTLEGAHERIALLDAPENEKFKMSSPPDRRVGPNGDITDWTDNAFVVRFRNEIGTLFFDTLLTTEDIQRLLMIPYALPSQGRTTILKSLEKGVAELEGGKTGYYQSLRTQMERMHIYIPQIVELGKQLGIPQPHAPETFQAHGVSKEYLEAVGRVFAPTSTFFQNEKHQTKTGIKVWNMLNSAIPAVREQYPWYAHQLQVARDTGNYQRGIWLLTSTAVSSLLSHLQVSVAIARGFGLTNLTDKDVQDHIMECSQIAYDGAKTTKKTTETRIELVHALGESNRYTFFPEVIVQLLTEVLPIKGSGDLEGKRFRIGNPGKIHRSELLDNMLG